MNKLTKTIAAAGVALATAIATGERIPEGRTAEELHNPLYHLPSTNNIPATAPDRIQLIGPDPNHPGKFLYNIMGS